MFIFLNFFDREWLNPENKRRFYNFLLTLGAEPKFLPIPDSEIENYEERDEGSLLVPLFKDGSKFVKGNYHMTTEFFRLFISEVDYQNLPYERKINVLEYFIGSLEWNRFLSNLKEAFRDLREALYVPGTGGLFRRGQERFQSYGGRP